MLGQEGLGTQHDFMAVSRRHIVFAIPMGEAVPRPPNGLDSADIGRLTSSGSDPLQGATQGRLDNLGVASGRNVSRTSVPRGSRSRTWSSVGEAGHERQAEAQAGAVGARRRAAAVVADLDDEARRRTTSARTWIRPGRRRWR